MAAQQIDQQRGNQGAVHDQARVAFDLGDVLAVVVDSMAVEGERRIAEQQHVVGHYFALPGCVFLSRYGRRRRVAGLGRCAVNNVVLLGQRQAPAVMHLMPDQHEQQIASAACLVGDGGYA